MMPPREQFTMIAELRIAASSLAPISPRVPSVSGTWIEITSAQASSSGRSIGVTPAAVISAGTSMGS